MLLNCGVGEDSWRVPWTAKRSNQSILKEISLGCSLEGLMLKLKLQYFGHLMQRADSFEKALMLGKIEARRRRGWQRMRWLDGITDSMDMGLGGLRGSPVYICVGPGEMGMVYNWGKGTVWNVCFQRLLRGSVEAGEEGLANHLFNLSCILLFIHLPSPFSVMV